VDKADACGRTSLWRAAREGREATAKALLAVGANVNARDALDAATPLYWAVTQCDPRMVSLLLTAGADVEGVTMAGCRALWWAAWMGHEAITRLLLQAGADSNATDPLGKGFVGGLVGVGLCWFRFFSCTPEKNKKTKNSVGLPVFQKLRFYI
jgi:ankyrin repeat protein